MQRLEVSGAVRPLYGSLGVKELSTCSRVILEEPKGPHSPRCGAAAQRGPWSPHSRGFWITHNDAPHSVGLLWTSDQLVAETST